MLQIHGVEKDYRGPACGFVLSTGGFGPDID